MKYIVGVILFCSVFSLKGQKLNCIYDSIPCCPAVKETKQFPLKTKSEELKSIEKKKVLSLVKAVEFKCSNGIGYVLFYKSPKYPKGYTIVQIRASGKIDYQWYDATNIYGSH